MHHLKYVQKLNSSDPCKGFFIYEGYHVVLKHPDNQVAKVTGDILLISISTYVSSPIADGVSIIISLAVKK